MKRTPAFLLLSALIGLLLYASCDPFPDPCLCKAHSEWIAENKTSKEIFLEYVDLHDSRYVHDDLVELYSYINQPPYDTFIVSYGHPLMEFLHIQFLIDGVSEAKTYILKKGLLSGRLTGRCDEDSFDNGSSWETYIYNLTDTTRFDLHGRADGYTGSESFTSLQWYYDTETDTNYTYCYLTIDSSALAAMHKDYTMLERFADYYSQKGESLPAEKENGIVNRMDK